MPHASLAECGPGPWLGGEPAGGADGRGAHSLGEHEPTCAVYEGRWWGGTRLGDGGWEMGSELGAIVTVAGLHGHSGRQEGMAITLVCICRAHVRKPGCMNWAAAALPSLGHGRQPSQ